jgi:hypothetical protein
MPAQATLPDGLLLCDRVLAALTCVILLGEPASNPVPVASSNGHSVISP